MWMQFFIEIVMQIISAGGAKALNHTTYRDSTPRNTRHVEVHHWIKELLPKSTYFAKSFTKALLSTHFSVQVVE